MGTKQKTNKMRFLLSTLRGEVSESVPEFRPILYNRLFLHRPGIHGDKEADTGQSHHEDDIHPDEGRGKELF